MDKGPRFWPLRWIMSERFWRDVVVQVTGTAAVVIAGFLWASAAGYLSPAAENAGTHWLAVAIGAALVIIALVQVFAVVYSVRYQRKEEGGRQLGYAFGLSITMVLMQALVAVPFLVGVFTGKYS